MWRALVYNPPNIAHRVKLGSARGDAHQQFTGPNRVVVVLSER